MCLKIKFLSAITLIILLNSQTFNSSEHAFLFNSGQIVVNLITVTCCYVFYSIITFNFMLQTSHRCLKGHIKRINQRIETLRPEILRFPVNDRENFVGLNVLSLDRVNYYLYFNMNGNICSTLPWDSYDKIVKAKVALSESVLSNESTIRCVTHDRLRVAQTIHDLYNQYLNLLRKFQELQKM